MSAILLLIVFSLVTFLWLIYHDQTKTVKASLGGMSVAGQTKRPIFVVWVCMEFKRTVVAYWNEKP